MCVEVEVPFEKLECRAQNIKSKGSMKALYSLFLICVTSKRIYVKKNLGLTVTVKYRNWKFIDSMHLHLSNFKAVPVTCIDVFL